MAEQTNDLKLFKYNTATDGKEVFSIEKSMNENWDKIDAFSSAIKSLSNLDAVGEKRFTDINTALSKKLEAEVLLAENGYIKFNNNMCICFGTQWRNTGNIAATNIFSTQITLPISYTTQVLTVVCSCNGPAFTTTVGGYDLTWVLLKYSNKNNENSSSFTRQHYIAIGI